MAERGPDRASQLEIRMGAGRDPLGSWQDRTPGGSQDTQENITFLSTVSLSNLVAGQRLKRQVVSSGGSRTRGPVSTYVASRVREQRVLGGRQVGANAPLRAPESFKKTR